ncbi:hypothetical protein [Photobacterium galatheae]|uniref:hypothetical protein n=1 Tax=Photobacterium galatheae TaxID=1654360 RepID=UPI0012696A88|nr:hypothetical protein [Photobacterium galatheae]MCM0149604.1 hypothetical protein [Photobacterium galatheae]
MTYPPETEVVSGEMSGVSVVQGDKEEVERRSAQRGMMVTNYDSMETPYLFNIGDRFNITSIGMMVTSVCTSRKIPSGFVQRKAFQSIPSEAHSFENINILKKITIIRKCII